jgi:hypothetical protein
MLIHVLLKNYHPWQWWEGQVPPIIEAFPLICMTLLFLNWLWQGAKESRARKERQRLQEWDRQKRIRREKAREDWMARWDAGPFGSKMTEAQKEESRRRWYERGKRRGWH